MGDEIQKNNKVETKRRFPKKWGLNRESEHIIEFF